MYVAFTVILGDIKVSQSVSNEMRYSGVTKPLPQVLPIICNSYSQLCQYLFSIFHFFFLNIIICYTT